MSKKATSSKTKVSAEENEEAGPVMEEMFFTEETRILNESP